MRHVAGFAVLAATAAAGANAFSPVLPTANDALFRGKPEDYYMFTEREFEGAKTFPWQGGKYGFTRGPERIGGKVVLTRFHEGIDIRPVRRDAAGEPLDDVRAIEAGTVVHASRDERDSNYGRYVVIEHRVGGAPVFSVYAHMDTVDVAPGERLARGARLGRLGYTGAGIDRRRAHLHLEIALLWHDGFESWHAANLPNPNKHGIHNGMNLIGLDAAALLLAQRRDPSLTLPAFIAGLEPAFRLRIPASPDFQLPARYPWLVRGEPASPRSWRATFTAAGFPVALEPLAEPDTGPDVEWLGPAKIPLAKASRGLVEGSPASARLGPAGAKLLALLTWNPAGAASAAPPAP